MAEGFASVQDFFPVHSLCQVSGFVSRAIYRSRIPFDWTDFNWQALIIFDIAVLQYNYIFKTFELINHPVVYIVWSKRIFISVKPKTRR